MVERVKGPSSEREKMASTESAYRARVMRIQQEIQKERSQQKIKCANQPAKDVGADVCGAYRVVQSVAYMRC